MRHLVFLYFLIFLSLMADAQTGTSAVTLKNGTVLKGMVKHIDPTDALTIEIAGIETKIKMSDVAQIEAIDTQKQIEVKKQPEDKNLVPMIVPDLLKDFKGFLLAKGNSVYVYCANSDDNPLSDYDKAGANVLKQLLKADGFWKVVDKMQQAHFTINYLVDTRRNDFATLSVSSWRTGKIIILNSKGANESISDNRDIARKFYKKSIVPLQRKIDKGKVSKRVAEYFTIKE